MSGPRLAKGPTLREKLIDEYGADGYSSDGRLRHRLVDAIERNKREAIKAKAHLGHLLGRSTRPTLYQIDTGNRVLKVVYVLSRWHPLEPATLRRWLGVRDYLTAHRWQLQLVTRDSEHSYGERVLDIQSSPA